MNSIERHEARYQRRKAKREARRRTLLNKYDNFDRVSNIASLMKANFESRRGVLWKASVARYNMHFFKNSVCANRKLTQSQDMHSGFYSFNIIERGKPRSIHSLHFSERVIRRSFCTNALVLILSHNLIYDNGASIKGKGITFAINRTATQLHQYFRRIGSNDGYILVIDFKKYFDNILHKPLMQIVNRYIHDPQLRILSAQNIASTNSDKSLENQGKGLYIGPEDSQIYAVAYPNSIDHKIKDQWRIKEFNRYMDDSYILCPDKKKLIQIRDALFMEYKKLGIIPNPKKTQIIKLSHGFTFLKTKFFLTDTGRVIMKPAHDSIVRQRRKLKKFNRFYQQHVMTLQQIEQSYMSWRGYILQKDSYRSIKNMDKLFYSLFGTMPWKNTKKKRRNRELWNKNNSSRAKSLPADHFLPTPTTSASNLQTAV